MLTTVFMGTPQFAVESLQVLAHHTDLALVVSQRDQPSGRGKKLMPQPVALQAKALGVELIQPKRIADPEVLERLRQIAPDLIVVTAYGQILPEEVLRLPRLGCINLHASLLPRWRGAAPIQHAIWQGDEASGVCAMQMEKGLDTGDVLATQKIILTPQETAGSLHDKLSLLSGEVLQEVLEKISQGTLERRPQASQGICYASKITRQSGFIDWKESAECIARQIRAMQPWPGAITRKNNQVIKLIEAEPLATCCPEEPGKLLTDGSSRLQVCCGEGILEIKSLQLPGKKPVSAQAYLRGHKVDSTTCLESLR